MEILFRLIKPGTEFVLSMLTFQGGYFFFPFSPPIALLQPQGGGAAQPLVLTEMDGGRMSRGTSVGCGPPSRLPWLRRGSLEGRETPSSPYPCADITLQWALLLTSVREGSTLHKLNIKGFVCRLRTAAFLGHDHCIGCPEFFERPDFSLKIKLFTLREFKRTNFRENF